MKVVQRLLQNFTSSEFFELVKVVREKRRFSEEVKVIFDEITNRAKEPKCLRKHSGRVPFHRTSCKKCWCIVPKTLTSSVVSSVTDTWLPCLKESSFYNFEFDFEFDVYRDTDFLEPLQESESRFEGFEDIVLALELMEEVTEESLLNNQMIVYQSPHQKYAELLPDQSLRAFKTQQLPKKSFEQTKDLLGDKFFTVLIVNELLRRKTSVMLSTNEAMKRLGHVYPMKAMMCKKRHAKTQDIFKKRDKRQRRKSVRF